MQWTGRRAWLPDLLPGAGQGLPQTLRSVWLALLLLAAGVQFAGLAFVLIDTYRLDPALRAVGIATRFGDDDRPIVEPLRADLVSAGVARGDRVIAVSQQQIGVDTSALSVARAIMAAPGERVSITFQKPDGHVLRVSISRTSRAPLISPQAPISVDVRLLIRLAFTSLSSAALLGSSFILLHRRPRDPEACLLGITFLLLAACVDPPLLMWMSLGMGWVIDAVTSLWWPLLVIALAAFPDGRFTPRWLRWSLIAAPLLSVILTANLLGDAGSLLLGVGVPLLLLAGQILRYRRLDPGTKRQQIKWAALGFAAGLLLVGAALAGAQVPYYDWPVEPRMVWSLAIICLFNLGFGTMPLGLLVALIRYRLWDVDRIISRSVAYTALSAGIIVLWALLSDMTKQAVSSLLGPDHAMLGLALGAVVAVAVFVPTQSLVLQWSRRRFNPASVALARLPERLRIWRERCDREEVAARALDLAMRALHASAGALHARGPNGRLLLASRTFDGDEYVDAALTPHAAAMGGGLVVNLEDEDGLAGWMVLEPRNDGTRFPRSEIVALEAAAAPLAQALRAAPPVRPREAVALDVLDEVQQRLARLEQQTQRPA